MRIRDWSSDVCSSDLTAFDAGRAVALRQPQRLADDELRRRLRVQRRLLRTRRNGDACARDFAGADQRLEDLDGKSVVKGKGGSGRVDIGGRRIITKKNKTND